VIPPAGADAWTGLDAVLTPAAGFFTPSSHLGRAIGLRFHRLSTTPPARALELGNNVVIDYGLWSRDERSALRQAAADLGAMVELRYFELTPAEQRRRLDQRQAEAPHTTWPMSDEELAEWAVNIDIPTPGELDGSEPMMTHRLDSRHGTSGADTAGRHRSPDACSSQRCHDRSSAVDGLGQGSG
jgi:predicted kinase